MISKLTNLVKTLTPASVIQSRLHQKVFMSFAEKVGFIHFGFVDQHQDEHHLIRGLTMSAHHRDNNYCIGNYKNYEIALTERSDTIKFPGKPSRAHHWIVMEFQLKAKDDLPHIFLGLHAHSQTFYSHLFTKFASLTKVPLGAFGEHSSAFTGRYALYTDPSKLLEAEQLFTTDITNVIAERFGSLTMEVAENSLYIYAEHQSPTEALLERMLRYGVWLSESIDAQSKKIH